MRPLQWSGDTLKSGNKAISSNVPLTFGMFCEYIQAAISKAVYEVIDDEEPYYGEVPELQGVWATGKTHQECQDNLRMAIEDWIAFSLRFDLPIPVIEGQTIRAPVEA